MISPRFDISVKREEDAEFCSMATNAEPFDISDRELRFSGEILYQTELDADWDYTVLDLGDVGEVAEAWLNGEYLGARITAPYKFDLGKALRDGKNELRILVKSNLGHRRRDVFSKYLPLPPSGIVGEIALCKYRESSPL